jgi:hypothetical protein
MRLKLESVFERYAEQSDYYKRANIALITFPVSTCPRLNFDSYAPDFFSPAV